MRPSLLQFSLVLLLFGISGKTAHAQFIETECSLLHPFNSDARLIGAQWQEDGETHFAPEIEYRLENGDYYSALDYRVGGYVADRQRKIRLLCIYRGAPDLYVDIPGLVNKCVLIWRDPANPKADPVYRRAYCESDISGGAN
ncbi:hypothetical protein [Ferrovibrio sp.]|uniref:hypothetical protein n=1 Tax=Ferrovibrio sp. TaxID=1917215 RepID=UPI0025C190BB|nr:hypothetical protein [Ferrovibrio sp.]MBX3453934.1 hypothetical protein [Ferrovibrio sp.]